MLLGIWKSIEELELTISLDELQAILEANRERELRDRRFAAALKGINLDEHVAADAKEKVEEMKRKIEALNEGLSEDQFEFNDLGLDFEEED
jgi:DNA-binding transcriptional MerR regulator